MAPNVKTQTTKGAARSLGKVLSDKTKNSGKAPSKASALSSVKASTSQVASPDLQASNTPSAPPNMQALLAKASALPPAQPPAQPPVQALP